MAEHKITVNQPEREIVNNDYQFSIRSDGHKLGTLGISKGSVDWWPRGTTNGTIISWEDFALIMDGFCDAPDEVRSVLRGLRNS